MAATVENADLVVIGAGALEYIAPVGYFLDLVLTVCCEQDGLASSRQRPISKSTLMQSLLSSTRSPLWVGYGPRVASIQLSSPTIWSVHTSTAIFLWTRRRGVSNQGSIYQARSYTIT